MASLFDTLAPEWWKESAAFQALHEINPHRLAWLKTQTAQHFSLDLQDPQALKGLHVLDVGCGGGLLSEPLTRMGAHVTGLDTSAQSIKKAEEHAQENKLSIRYLQTTLEAFAAQEHHTPKAFDLVVAFEVVEHVENVQAFLHQASTLLSEGGLFLCSTLNRTFLSYVLGVKAAEQWLGWIPEGTHNWEKFITPPELALYAEQAKLKPLSQTGLNFSPKHLTWRFSSSTQINYFMSFDKQKGEGQQ